MIHLDLTTEHGFLYLDVQQIEAREEVFALTGTLGDGLDEGQVLLEIGERVEILFVDEWLGDGGLSRLLGREGREPVRAALMAAVADIRFCLQTFPVAVGLVEPRVTGFFLNERWTSLRPREYGEQLELPLRVAEPAVTWGKAA